MPRVTKAMLEEEAKYLRINLRKQENRAILAENEAKHLLNIIKIYQGMETFNVASERISDALAHTLYRLKEKQ